MCKIRIIMGSQSDLETVNETINVLKEFKVNFEGMHYRKDIGSKGLI